MQARTRPRVARTVELIVVHLDERHILSLERLRHLAAVGAPSVREDDHVAGFQGGLQLFSHVFLLDGCGGDLGSAVVCSLALQERRAAWGVSLEETRTTTEDDADEEVVCVCL